MNPLLGIGEGFREIWSHKFRSLLTMLGVVLAVTSLMATFAVTTGMAEGFRRILTQWGGVNRVQILDAEVPEEQQATKDISPGQTYRDVIALRQHLPYLDYVAPEKRINRGLTFRLGDNVVGNNRVRGVEQTFLLTSSLLLERGRMITDLDLERRHRVMVLGEGMVQALWRGSRTDPVGARVRVDNDLFQVVGVFAPSGSRYMDMTVIMPITTMQDIYFSAQVQDGVDLGPDARLDRIYLGIPEGRSMDQVLDHARNILLQTHRGIQDFGFETREDWGDSVESTVRGTQLSGGLISLVTLIAAGVGITNIMLASIKERTREIGIRRAVGARAGDVFLQVVMESLVLAVIGGMLGLVAGYYTVEFLKTIAMEDQMPVLRAEAAWISLAISALVGFLAGLVPAAKAAALKPIEALRFE